MLLLSLAALAAETPAAAASRLLTAATRGDDPAAWFDVQAWAMAEALPMAGFAAYIAMEGGGGDGAGFLDLFADNQIDAAEWAGLRTQGAATATELLQHADCTAGDTVESHVASAHPPDGETAVWPERAQLRRLVLLDVRCKTPEVLVLIKDVGIPVQVTGLALTESTSGWRLAAVLLSGTGPLWTRFGEELEVDAVAVAAAKAAKLAATDPPAFTSWTPPGLPRRTPARADDLDGDGKVDVVLPALDAAIVGVVRGGTLTRIPQTFHSEGFGRVAAVADVDGDGASDLVVSAPGQSTAGGPAVAGSIWIFPGGRGLDLTHHQRITEVDPRFGDLRAISDLDGDGRADLVIRREHNVEVRFGGALDRAGAVLPFPDRNYGMYGLTGVGDVDGDGADDLWLRDHVRLESGDSKGKDRAFLIHGGPSATVEAVSVLDGVYALAGADLTGDGRNELLGISDQEVAAYTHKRAGWTRVWSLGASGCTVAAVADFGGDDKPEIALGCASGSGEVRIVSATGKLLHTLTGDPKGKSFGKGVLAPGDVDGDGRIDLVIQGPDTAWLYTNPLTATAPTQTWSVR